MVWYSKMKDKGLRVKLALDDSGEVGGMYCIWVHGSRQGRGNFQKKGMGKALLQATENDVKAMGVKGTVAWGIPLPFWMKTSWFKKQGHSKVDKQGFLRNVLLWKPFTDDAIPSKWIRQQKRPKEAPGKVAVTAFLNGWCPAQNLVFGRAQRAASEFRDKVVFRKIDTFDKETFLEWGITDALFIDNKQMQTGPPPSYEKIKGKIAKRVRKS